MQKKSLMAFGVLTVLIINMTSVSAIQRTPVMDSYWVWNWAKTVLEDEMKTSGITITSEDIAYARQIVDSMEKSCAEYGDIQCQLLEEDKQTLEKLLRVQASQGGMTSDEPVAANNMLSKAWSQLKYMMKSVELIKQILGQGLYDKFTGKNQTSFFGK
jgi:hypothetical protein